MFRYFKVKDGDAVVMQSKDKFVGFYVDTNSTASFCEWCIDGTNSDNFDYSLGREHNGDGVFDDTRPVLVIYSYDYDVSIHKFEARRDEFLFLQHAKYGEDETVQEWMHNFLESKDEVEGVIDFIGTVITMVF